MSTAPPLELLPWDSEFFGMTVARLTGPRLREQDLPAVLSWCRDHGVECLYFLADPADPETLSAAHAGEFKFVDMRIDLEIPEGKFVALASDNPGTNEGVRAARTDDADALQTVARRSHINTRFFKDTRFSQERSADLYAVWIRVSLEDSRKVVLVKDGPSGEIAGYVACEMTDGAAIGRIGLIAVDPLFRHQGIASSLVRAAIGWCRARGARTLRVTTQADNLSALNLYGSAGFSHTGFAAWFHLWF